MVCKQMFMSFGGECGKVVKKQADLGSRQTWVRVFALPLTSRDLDLRLPSPQLEMGLKIVPT